VGAIIQEPALTIFPAKRRAVRAVLIDGRASARWAQPERQAGPADPAVRGPVPAWPRLPVEYLDATVRDRADLESLNLNVLGRSHVSPVEANTEGR